VSTHLITRADESASSWKARHQLTRRAEWVVHRVVEFIVVGAGAVGAVIGSLLEHAGHSVAYWLRSPRESLPAFEVQRAAGVCVRSRAPVCVSADTEVKPDSDWVLVCVRTEQLSDALRQVALQLGAARAVAIATITVDGALHSARAAGLTGRVLALHVAFGSQQEAPRGGQTRQLSWFPFSAPSSVSSEGQPALRAPARELAKQLDAAGVPTRAVSSMSDSMRWLAVATTALLPAWEQCGWDIRGLAAHGELRTTAARAMHEASGLVAAPRGIVGWLSTRVPAAFYRGLIRLLPLLMGPRAGALWRQHGPKVREQTGYVLRDMLERAQRQGRSVPALTTLYAVWQAQRDGT
jgi:ketopantoate reductase